MAIQLNINKYKLYFVLIAILFGYSYFPKLWYALTYNRTSGIVDSFTYTESKGYRSKTTNYYPVVLFTVNNNIYSCLGSSFQHDELYRLNKVTVIYDGRNPKKAFVYTTLGFWAPPLVYVLPLFVIISAILLSVGSLPKILRIKI